MYYFDSEYLKQFLGTGSSVKVFDGNEYLEIVDTGDLDHPQTGVGYTQTGEPVRFDYKDVTQTLVGNTVFTLDMLRHEIEKKENPEAFSDEGDEEEEGGEEGSEEGEGGASVDSEFGGLGGGGGDDFGGGDIGGEGGEDFGDEVGGDMEGGGDIEGGEDFGDELGGDEGGGEEQFGDDDFGAEGDEGGETDDDIVGDSVILQGDQIINEGVPDGETGRYGYFIAVDSTGGIDIGLYETYCPNERRMVLRSAPLKNLRV